MRAPLDKLPGARQPREMRRRLIILGASVGALTLVATIVALAHAYSPTADAGKCFSNGFLHAQWPKWIWCTIAAREGLAGGLIGAVGALLAAFVAAYAVWQQLAFERFKFELAEKRREALELYNLERVVEYYGRYLKVFDAAAGVADSRYVNGLDTLYKAGRLAPFFGALPPEQQSLVRDDWERLQNLNHALIECRQSGPSGVGDLKSRSAINEGIEETVSDMRQHLAMAKQAITNQQDG